MTTTSLSRTEQWRRALSCSTAAAAAAAADESSSFSELSRKYPIPREDEQQQQQQQPTQQQSTASSPLDPLTAMYMQDLQEQTAFKTRQSQYRKQKRSQTTTEPVTTLHEQQTISWQILQKDLQRLPSPDSHQCLTHRNTLIAQVLYTWLCHTNTEYQQGMHEVVSYLLLALEYDDETDFSQRLWEFVVVVLPALLPAYDSSTVQDMTQRILQTLQQYHPLLYQRIQHLPLALVFLKWIRLLFAREVCDVLRLWDTLFLFPLLEACEALCVARLLLHREYLLESTTSDALLYRLMNMAPEEEESSLDLWMTLCLRIVHGAAVEDLLSLTSSTTTSTTTTSQTQTATAWTDPLSHAFSQLTTPHNHTFSTLKERLVQQSEQLWTHKIQPVRQRLFAGHHDAERNYDYCDAERNYDYSDVERNNTAQHMQQALDTITGFLKQQQTVPAAVKEAMLQLQMIQQDLSRQHY